MSGGGLKAGYAVAELWMATTTLGRSGGSAAVNAAVVAEWQQGSRVTGHGTAGHRTLHRHRQQTGTTTT